MLLAAVRIVYLLICSGVLAAFCFGWAGLGDREATPSLVREYPFTAFLILEAIVLSVIGVDFLFPRKRVDVMSAIYIGLLIGALLSYLLIQALSPLFISDLIFGSGPIGEAWKGLATLLTTLMLSYVCIAFLLQTKDDFRFVIPYVEFARSLKGGRPIILDTSALIDGRIADLIETNIVDAELVVPSFVLREVQEIADAPEKQRRTRGRRGLEVLRKLQSDARVEVRVQDAEPPGKGKSIDQATVDLAREISARVLTSDFSLNKLLAVHGVQAVNLNDVASALRPRFLPGEMLRIKVKKEGESPGQGVGYLDDGTMVVCEGASRHLGQEVEAEVTSVLQTSAGRMIFAREHTVVDER